RARRGARMAALTSGGAIPELGDYRVLAEPDDALVGTVNEDWAIESMAGDIFLLGTTSWRIRRVEPGIVRVEDAHGAPPSVPFWLGEAPGRTVELSEEVSSLRAAIASLLAVGEDSDQHVDQAGAVSWLMAECGVDAAAAETIAAYLSSALAQLGVLPTMDTSLAWRRMGGGKKNPPAIQRMEADDLMAAVFPTLAACQENVAPGPMEIPDQVLVRQTLTDCLREAMDVDGLKELVSGIEGG